MKRKRPLIVVGGVILGLALLANFVVGRRNADETAGDGTRESQGVPSLVPSERSQFIKSAQAELERLRVPWEGREPTVVLNSDEVTVTFPPPKGARAGSFIIKLERETQKILDVKIWR